jgi:hypothetical protein
MGLLSSPSVFRPARSQSTRFARCCSQPSGPFPSISTSLSPLRLPPVQDRFHDVGRHAGER